MGIQFIDITSYRGICSDAEHWYAKYISDFKNANECLAIDGTSVYGWDEEVKFYPTREEAIALIKKENQVIGASRDVEEWKIQEMMDNGTIRFSSILDIIKTCRKEFPKSILVFSIRGSQKDFKKWLIGMYESKDKETQNIAEEIIKTIVEYEGSES